MASSPETLVLMEEATYGNPVLTTGAVDYTLATTFPVVLPESNGFNVEMKPTELILPLGGGLDVALDVQADQHATVAQLSTYATPALLAFLLNAAVVRSDGSGTVPYATDAEAGDLASLSAYHSIRMRGGTVKRRKLTGGKIQTLSGTCSRSDPRLKLTATIVFQKETGNAVESSADPDATEFPLMADTNIPTAPYLFSESSANFKYDGSAIVSYNSLGFTINNKLAIDYFESRFPSDISLEGREATVTADVLYKASPDYRAAYQALTSKSLSLKFLRGSWSSKLDFGAVNKLTDCPFDLPLGQKRMQKISFLNLWNPSTAKDIAITNTHP